MNRGINQDVVDVLSERKFKVKPGDIRGMKFPDFLCEHIVCDKGNYTFTGREPLHYIAANPHKWNEVAVEKGTQEGLTTLFMAYGLWRTAQDYDCGYCVPTSEAGKGFFDRFERTRKANKTLKRLKRKPAKK